MPVFTIITMLVLVVAALTPSVADSRVQDAATTLGSMLVLFGWALGAVSATRGSLVAFSLGCLGLAIAVLVWLARVGFRRRAAA